MNDLFKSKKTIYLFISIFILLAFYAKATYDRFAETKEAIIKSRLKVNIGYIDEITSNISAMILKSVGKKPLLQVLKENETLRRNLEQNIRFLVTKRYRYIYVLYKERNKDIFRFLLDSSTKDKAEFLETFQPLEIEKWKKVYRTKKAVYFKNDIKSLWLTYLKPIIQNGEVAAIIAIDFSLAEQNELQNILENLSQKLQIFTLFSIAMFVVLILFLLYEQKKVAILNRQAQEIKAFNETLQQRVQEEVAKNREKDKQILEQARLAQMGEMLGMIAHQWRQPLSAISSTNIAINLKAQMGQLDAESIIKLTEKIEEFTQHLSKTIDDFRNFFKKTKEKKKASLNEIVDSTLEIVSAALKNKNITLIADLQSDLKLPTYPDELKQVLLNLIKNAEDVLIEKGVKNPYIKIITKDNIIQVSDNGGGISDEIIAKIFDPYFSTKGLNGTGLGLYMSKIIVEEHCQGKLSVANDDEGAVFTVELPKKG